MWFEVPITKGEDFAGVFFSTISDRLVELKQETGKWPDRVTFSGPIGQELLSFVKQKEWDLERFGPTHEGVVNKIVFHYSKPIDQIEEIGGTIFDEALHGKTVNGLPGAETVHKILSAYAAPGFTIQRQIRPKREILLIRKNS